MCRKAIVAAVLSWIAATPIALAGEPASPRPSSDSRAAVAAPRSSASLPAVDAGRADELRWLAVPGLHKASAMSEAQSPRWSWSVVGVLTLGLLGLMSFGWREGPVPAVLAASACGERQGPAPVDPPTPPRSRRIDMPSRARDAVSRPHFQPAYGSVCVGLCGGGQVWDVACAD